MNMEDLYRLLRSGHIQAQGIVDTIEEPLVVLDEASCVIEANRAFFATFLVERDDTIGCSLFSLGGGQWNIAELRRLISDIIPKSAAVVDYEVTHDFPFIGERTFLLNARRLYKPDNNSTHILLIFTDVTNIRAKERETTLMYSELRHRLINLLGVVQAIANQIDTKGKSAEEYKTTFLQRFRALSKAQSMMANGRSSIELASLASQVLSPLGGERIVLSGGPPLAIPDHQVLPITMILSELATNSLKYGALGPSGGAVDVGWEFVPADGHSQSLRLVWQEACRTPLAVPGDAGMGTTIIEDLAEFSLRGIVDMKFEREGLRATLLVPGFIGDGQLRDHG